MTNELETVVAKMRESVSTYHSMYGIHDDEYVYNLAKAAFKASVQLLIDIRGKEVAELEAFDDAKVFAIRWLKEILKHDT